MVKSFDKIEHNKKDKTPSAFHEKTKQILETYRNFGFTIFNLKRYIALNPDIKNQNFEYIGKLAILLGLLRKNKLIAGNHYAIFPSLSTLQIKKNGYQKRFGLPEFIQFDYGLELFQPYVEDKKNIDDFQFNEVVDIGKHVNELFKLSKGGNFNINFQYHALLNFERNYFSFIPCINPYILNDNPELRRDAITESSLSSIIQKIFTTRPINPVHSVFGPECIMLENAVQYEQFCSDVIPELTKPEYMKRIEAFFEQKPNF